METVRRDSDCGKCESCNDNFKDLSSRVCICNNCFTRLKALVLQQEEEEKAFKPSSSLSSDLSQNDNNNTIKMVLFLEMPHINKKRRFLYQPMSLHKELHFDQLCSKLIHRFASRNVRLPNYSNDNDDVTFEINDSIHKDEYITFENLNDLFDGCRIKIIISQEYLTKRAERDEKLRERAARSRGNSNVSNFSTYSSLSNASRTSIKSNKSNSPSTPPDTSDIKTSQQTSTTTTRTITTPIESSSNTTPTITTPTTTLPNRKSTTLSIENESDTKKDDFGNVIALTSKSNSLTDSPVMVSIPQNVNNNSNGRKNIIEVETKESKSVNTITNNENNQHSNMQTISPNVSNFALTNTNNNNQNNNNNNFDNNNFSRTRHVFDNSLDLKQRYKDSIASFNLYSSPIVIDNGSGIIKGGFSHHVDSLHGPQYTMPNAYYDASGPNSKGLIGQDAIDACIYNKDGYNFSIFENGTIKDFDKMSFIWNQLLNDILKKEYNKIISNNNNHNNNNNNSDDLEFNLENHSILMTDRYNSPMKQREKFAEILFEQYNVPGLFLANPACLAIYSSGKTKGVVLDIGHQTTTVASVYEGTTIPNSGTKVICNHSGFELTKSIMNKYYNECELNYKTASRLKEDIYQVPYDSIDIENCLSEEIYKLPDGRKIKLGRDRFELALGHMFGNVSELSVSKLVNECILSINDIELQNTLWKNIILSGGTSLMNGLAERFAKEIRHLTKIKTQVIATKNRKNKVWIGGSVVASISTFNDLAVSKDKYNEIGTSIVQTMQL